MPQQPGTPSFDDELARFRAKQQAPPPTTDTPATAGPPPGSLVPMPSHTPAQRSPADARFGKGYQSFGALPDTRVAIPGLAAAAGVLTGGASWPLQMAAQSAIGALGGAADERTAEGAAVGAGMGAIASGAGSLLGGIGGRLVRNSFPREVNAASVPGPKVVLPTEGTKTMAPGPAASDLQEMLPFGFGKNAAAAGRFVGVTENDANKAIRLGGRTMGAAGASLPTVAQIVRQLLLGGGNGGS